MDDDDDMVTEYWPAPACYSLNSRVLNLRSRSSRRDK